MRIVLGLLLFMSVSPLYISLNQPITAEQAGIYQNRLIQVRGFLYHLPSGELILADQPNLKSCCIGSKHLAEHQIQIKGNISLQSNAVTLQGVFRVQKDSLLPYYLDDPQLIETSRSILFWIASGLVALFIFRWIRNKKYAR